MYPGNIACTLEMCPGTRARAATSGRQAIVESSGGGVRATALAERVLTGERGEAAAAEPRDGLIGLNSIRV